MKHYAFYILTILLVCSIGIIFYLLSQPKDISKDKVIDQKDSYYYENSLIAPDVAHIPKEDRLINFTSLRQDLITYIASESAHIGMYFEYIPTGNSIGIHDRDPFVYASLLKVPLVMSVYNKINKGKLSLDEEHPLTQRMINDKYGELWKRGVGAKVSVREAIEQTLTVSDNTAAEFLRSLMTTEEFTDIFAFLDIPVYLFNDQPGVAPKNYTSILRSLYYASFLPENYSKEILTILTHSSYSNGIHAYIPNTIPVAHKMGIRNEYEVLSDCGIIYLPGKPYFLCIMVNDKDVDEATNIIQTISKRIYNFLTS